MQMPGVFRGFRGALCLSLMLVLLLLLTGCSRTALLYDHADWMAMRWVTGLLDGDSDQETAWQARFGEVVDSHRSQLLPEVVVALRSFEAQAETGIRGPALECWLQSVDALYARHVELVLPVATDVLLSARPEQIDHLERELAERSAELRDERLFEDPQRQMEVRVDRYRERIERWTGDLSGDQRAALALAVARLPDVAPDWFDYRQQMQGELVAMLRAGADADRLQAFLRDWWLSFAGRPARLRQDMDALRHGMVGLIARLDRDLSAAQRETLLDKVRDLREGLESVDPAVAEFARRHSPGVSCAERLASQSPSL
jgi:hypothetical protein